MNFRPIHNRAELDTVYRLTHDAYVEQGYIRPRRDGRLAHYPYLEGIPETIVLVAEEEGRIVGTNSLTFDGPRGLHVDEDFRVQCDRVRGEEGRPLAASWRIVTHSDYHGRRDVVMGLIQETLNQMVAHEYYTSVFTFNPRHERIYRRLLNMNTLARNQRTQGLNNAPAVFMRLRFEDVPARWLVTEHLCKTREVLRASAGSARALVRCA